MAETVVLDDERVVRTQAGELARAREAWVQALEGAYYFNKRRTPAYGPPLAEHRPGRWVACWHAGRLLGDAA